MLNRVMIANALSCLGFGALFVAFSAPVAGFLGDPPVLILRLLGLGLIFNGVHLIWVARQDRPKRRDVLYFATSDALWVAGTAVLLLGGFWITTNIGMALAVLVAVWVGGCGVLQWRYAPSS